VLPYSPDSPWDFEPGITFLTHGTFGACPRPVLEFQAELVRQMDANPIRFFDRELEERLDAARREVASFLNADPEGTVVVPNATSGVATALASLRLRPGDELLTNDHEYNATLNQLDAAADRAKARVVRVSVPLPIRHPEEVVEAHLAAVTPRTRVALISHVTSPSGLVFPIAKLVRELDRLGVDTIVDAAHAPGMLPNATVGLIGGKDQSPKLKAPCAETAMPIVERKGPFGVAHGPLLQRKTGTSARSSRELSAPPLSLGPESFPRHGLGDGGLPLRWPALVICDGGRFPECREPAVLSPERFRGGCSFGGGPPAFTGRPRSPAGPSAAARRRRSRSGGSLAPSQSA